MYLDVKFQVSKSFQNIQSLIFCLMVRNKFEENHLYTTCIRDQIPDHYGLVCSITASIPCGQQSGLSYRTFVKFLHGNLMTNLTSAVTFKLYIYVSVKMENDSG